MVELRRPLHLPCLQRDSAEPGRPCSAAYCGQDSSSRACFTEARVADSPWFHLLRFGSPSGVHPRARRKSVALNAAISSPVEADRDAGCIARVYSCCRLERPEPDSHPRGSPSDVEVGSEPSHARRRNRAKRAFAIPITLPSWASGTRAASRRARIASRRACGPLPSAPTQVSGARSLSDSEGVWGM